MYDLFLIMLSCISLCIVMQRPTVHLPDCQQVWVIYTRSLNISSVWIDSSFKSYGSFIGRDRLETSTSLVKGNQLQMGGGRFWKLMLVGLKLNCYTSNGNFEQAPKLSHLYIFMVVWPMIDHVTAYQLTYSFELISINMSLLISTEKGNSRPHGFSIVTDIISLDGPRL